VADVELLGQDVPVQFLNRGQPFLNVDDAVPLYMAVMGPKGLAMAGRLADAVILGGITEPALIDRCRELIDEGARRVGRRVSDLEIAVTPSVFVTDGATDFEHLREALGPKSLAPAKIYSRLAESTPGIAGDLATDMARVRDAAYAGTSGPAEDPRRRHLTAYRGYLTKLQPWQVPLITPRVLEATSVAGTAEQCAQTVKRLEKHGVSHVIVSPRPQETAATIERFGRDVIPRCT
jgi:alkanesulfonate monooxygenase SsuD/methylene tetrahydromethanopterin reductase-like flavin-dependent oxidoreductase (luciferase family)